MLPETVGGALASAGRLFPATIAPNQVPLVAIALLGDGTRRPAQPPGDAGPAWVRSHHPPLVRVRRAVRRRSALAFVRHLLALLAAFQLDLFERVVEIPEDLFSPADMSPVATILFALLADLGTAAGEETVFRGQSSPRSG